jgi:hypothetical protein
MRRKTHQWLSPLTNQRLIVLIAALIFVRLCLYALVTGAFTNLPAALCQWDCDWFLSTAATGYNRHLATTGVIFGQANWVDFPVFPCLIHLTAFLFHLPGPLAGLLTANLALGAFVYLAVKYLALTAPGQAGLAVVLFLLCYPYGFYLSLAYTESTYAAFGMAAFYFLARGAVLPSALAASCLAATRVTGVLFTPIIVVRAAGAARAAWRQSGRRAATATLANAILPIAIAPLGLFLFMAYLYLHMGDAYAFLHIQRGWGRSESNPLAVLLSGLQTNDMVTAFSAGRASRTFAALCALAGLALCARLLRLRRFAECWFLFASILIALSAGLLAFPRYCLANPIFMVWLFEFCRNALPRWAFAPLTGIFLLLQLYLIHLWIHPYGFLI